MTLSRAYLYLNRYAGARS